MLNDGNIIYKLLQYYDNELYRFYCMILSYNPILGSYDRIQHVIIMALELIQFYLSISSQDNVE